jgi:hypothetical protein
VVIGLASLATQPWKRADRSHDITSKRLTIQTDEHDAPNAVMEPERGRGARSESFTYPERIEFLNRGRH